VPIENYGPIRSDASQFEALLSGCTRRPFGPSANFQSFRLSAASKSAIGRELFDGITIRDELLILSVREDLIPSK
jgi:hypothetical protein